MMLPCGRDRDATVDAKDAKGSIVSRALCVQPEPVHGTTEIGRSGKPLNAVNSSDGSTRLDGGAIDDGINALDDRLAFERFGRHKGSPHRGVCILQLEGLEGG